jgi:hypothetical protein
MFSIIRRVGLENTKSHNFESYVSKWLFSSKTFFFKIAPLGSKIREYDEVETEVMSRIAMLMWTIWWMRNQKCWNDQLPTTVFHFIRRERDALQDWLQVQAKQHRQQHGNAAMYGKNQQEECSNATWTLPVITNIIAMALEHV